MWICPKCQAEVEDGFEICWACGTSADGKEDPDFDPEFDGVMDEATYRETAAARQREEFVTVATVWKPAQAHILRSRLEAEGIHVFLADEETITMDWLLSNAIDGVKVQVPSKDVERARQVLADRLGPEALEPADKDDEETSP